MIKKTFALLIIAFCVAITPVASAANTAEDHLFSMMASIQNAQTSNDPEQKRTLLVEAAYEARRIVEDFPNSPSALSLLGEGVAIFGSEPITYEAVGDTMISACLDELNILCLVDVYYTEQERRFRPRVEQLLKDKKALGQRDENFAPGFSVHRTITALAYAELGLTDRVKATYAHHRRIDGTVTMSERAVWAGRYGFALLRVGDAEAAWDVVPDLLADTRTDPKLQSWIETYTVSAPERIAIALAYEESSQEELNQMMGELDLVSLFRRSEDAHTFSTNATLRSFLMSHLDSCLELRGFSGRNCINTLIPMYAKVGDVAAVKSIANRSKNPTRTLRASLYTLLNYGHLDQARTIISDLGEEASLSPRYLAQIALLSDDDTLLEEAKTKARETTEESGFNSRDALIEDVVEVLARHDRVAEARLMANEISDVERKSRVVALLDFWPFQGLIAQGQYIDAFLGSRSTGDEVNWPSYETIGGIVSDAFLK